VIAGEPTLAALTIDDNYLIRQVVSVSSMLIADSCRQTNH
jgi:hypothetical protein